MNVKDTMTIINEVYGDLIFMILSSIRIQESELFERGDDINVMTGKSG
jgi:hypothetical protein